MSVFGKQKTLGSFKTIEEASECYQLAKKEYIKEIANTQKDVQLKNALLQLSFS